MRKLSKKVVRLCCRALVRTFTLIKVNRLWIIIALLAWNVHLNLKPAHDISKAAAAVQTTAEWQATTAKDIGSAFWAMYVVISQQKIATDRNTVRLDSIRKSRGMSPIFDEQLLMGDFPLEGPQEAE